jgi:phage gp46-like protein
LAEFSWTLGTGELVAVGGRARSRLGGGDVRLFHTDDGGEIEFINGTAITSDGLETAVYLSLFGGNERDGAISATEKLQWWGNFSEPLEARQYRSETQYLLRSLAAVTANLRKIEDAAERDLSWLTTDGLAKAVAVSATMPALNKVRIAPLIEIDDARFEYAFTEAWRMRASQ